VSGLPTGLIRQLTRRNTQEKRPRYAARATLEAAMTAITQPAVASIPAKARLERWWRRWVGRAAALTENEPAMLGALMGGSVLLGAWAQVAVPTLATPAAQTLPLMVGGLLLERRRLRWLTAVVAAVISVNAVTRGPAVVRPGLIVVLSLLAFLADVLARGRQRVGITGLRGESMLAELRERLEAQGQLPPLPAGWHAERALAPAGGGGFAGDFVVSACTRDGRQLEVGVSHDASGISSHGDSPAVARAPVGRGSGR